MSAIILNFVLIIFAMATAITAMRLKNLVSAIFALGAFSFIIALLWSLLAAPDVSFTEAVIGVGASTIFFLLALFNTDHVVKERKTTASGWISISICILLTVLFVYASGDLPSFADPFSPASTHLSPYYLENAIKHSHTPNIVTAVVVDYRGFDTLIEAAVIFTAGVACLLIMRSKA